MSIWIGQNHRRHKVLFEQEESSSGPARKIFEVEQL